MGMMKNGNPGDSNRVLLRRVHKEIVIDDSPYFSPAVNFSL